MCVTATLSFSWSAFSSICSTRHAEGLRKHMSPVSTGSRQSHALSSVLGCSKTRRITVAALMTTVLAASQTLLFSWLNSCRNRLSSRGAVCCVSWAIFCFTFQIHADLALVPPATVCGKPNAVLVTLLRHALLQVSAERRVWSGSACGQWSTETQGSVASIFRGTHLCGWMLFGILFAGRSCVTLCTRLFRRTIRGLFVCDDSSLPSVPPSGMES